MLTNDRMRAFKPEARKEKHQTEIERGFETESWRDGKRERLYCE